MTRTGRTGTTTSRLAVRDDAFDVAGFRGGVGRSPDLPGALVEKVRVTPTGGRVGVAVYGPSSEVEFLDIFLTAVRAVAPEVETPPMDPPPIAAQVADADELRRAMNDAGLLDVRVVPSVERLVVGSGEDLWDWILDNHPELGELVADLTEDQRVEVQMAMDGILLQRSRGHVTAVIENVVLIGVGTVRRADAGGRRRRRTDGRTNGRTHRKTDGGSTMRNRPTPSDTDSKNGPDVNAPGPLGGLL